MSASGSIRVAVETCAGLEDGVPDLIRQEFGAVDVRYPHGRPRFVEQLGDAWSHLPVILEAAADAVVTIEFLRKLRARIKTNKRGHPASAATKLRLYVADGKGGERTIELDTATDAEFKSILGWLRKVLGKR
jgi:hypothetical protein